MQIQAKTTLILVVFSILSCVSTRGSRDPANLTSMGSEKNILTYDKFMTIVKNESVEDIAGLIKILGERYPEHLQFRTMMYDSRSLQGATFTEPRVIVFGPLADFVFTFNGSKDQRGGGTVELMRFDQVRKEFQFSEIGFKKELRDGKLNFLLDDEFELDNERITISKSNPTKCLDCHGYTKPGPIWDNHFFWPGAFGSNDDLLYSSFRKNMQHAHGMYMFLDELKWPRSQGRALDLADGAPDAELNGYIAYLKSAPAHARYKYLPAQIVEAGFRKFIAGTPVDQIDENQNIADLERIIGRGELDRPNGYLGSALLKFSMTELAARISKNPALLRRIKNILSESTIAYPFFWGSTRVELFNVNVDSIHERLPWLKEIEEKRGAFKFHLQKALQEEIDLQTEKTQRHEQLLQTKLVVNPKWTMQHGDDPTPAITAYGKLLGHSLSRVELLGMEWEVGLIPDLALIDYVLMDAGIDFSDYEINFTKNGTRKFSYHSSTYEYLSEILGVTRNSPKSTY